MVEVVVDTENRYNQAMTQLLEQALAKVHELPEEKQDAIATLILEAFDVQASAERRALLALPIEERRQVLERQAESLLEHYHSDDTWCETEVGDLFEY